ncbi:pyridoxal phosphate-dependent aminotransferase [uncultured Bacteroides sp.]|uniref:pyridoxal phosphate-dependent aminotransferase n=1 Tax=uncultured Bacteroides sp. TaxID=162156 RepID=UPI00260B9CA8|nr:pyridoxal phosphate-dependent aminotransferase [uncultured Bacteroides sp.]
MNKNIENLTPFLVMDVLERANTLQREGIDIIHLEVGEPDFDIPACALKAAKEAYNEGFTHYTHSQGDFGLREEIARFYRNEYGVTVSPEQIIVTSGTSPALLMLMLMLCEPDSEVIITNPGYACYHNFIEAAGARPVLVELDKSNKFRFDIKKVKAVITPKTRALFINSPMNPTGALLPEETLKEIARLPIPVISDEIYHGLVYEGTAHSILEFTDQAFVLNGFSKRYAMTGARLGYVIAPQAYVRTLQIMSQNFSICAPSVAQKAGIAALREGEPEVEQMRKIYDERRRYMMKRLAEIGLPPIAEPQGAFYIFTDASAFTKDSYRFAFEILEKAHVGVTPGVDFGSQGEGCIRFSYANSLENIKEGLERIESFLKTYKK